MLNSIITNRARLALLLALGGSTFLSLAHHVFNFWELPALAIVALIAAFVPLTGWLLSRPAARLAAYLPHLNKPRLIAMVLFASIAGAFIAWRIYRAPVDYQTVTITPDLSAGETVTLLELKQDGHRVKLETAALESSWEARRGVLLATADSEPLTIAFKSRTGAPIVVLFTTSFQGGAVRVGFEGQSATADLRGVDGGELALNFSARYRGLPNWLFVSLLFIIDAFMLAALVFALLLLQHAGEHQAEANVEERFPSHRTSLLILLGLGVIFHLASALTTPLLIYSDSPAYLRGAVYWLEHGSLAGVPVFRGPGTTFLFAPILVLFGRNPWGMKVLLHLIAIMCIPLSYRLAWQLSARRWIAFMGGLFALLSPDLYLYSNFVMSDLINLALVLVFCTLMIAAFRAPSFRTVLAMMLTGSLAALVRSENVLLPAIGLIVLVWPHVVEWLRLAARPRAAKERDLAQRRIRSIAFAFALAVLPLVWWSIHHYRLHGFFSLGNHSGVVLYDGWVYYGDASKLSFSDPDSPAMQRILAAMEAHGAEVSDRTGAPTSLELYPALKAAGYSDYELFELLEQAAWDSIARDPALTRKLLFIKLEASLVPEIYNTATYLLPGEPSGPDPVKAEFFDLENLSIPPLIRMQRVLNEQIFLWYPRLYPIWIFVFVLALGLSLFRSPAVIWIPLALIVATRIFVPAVMALSSWRYTLAGWIPLQIIAVCVVVSIAAGARTELRTLVRNYRLKSALHAD